MHWESLEPSQFFPSPSPMSAPSAAPTSALPGFRALVGAGDWAGTEHHVPRGDALPALAVCGWGVPKGPGHRDGSQLEAG